MTNQRTAQISRKTNETEISVDINIDGSGEFDISTGIGFFDHMLEQLSKHSLIDMKISAKGDLHIDGHHTVEDTGLALGLALKSAIGDKKGINRYGNSFVPMDEALARVVLDFSGRPILVWDVPLDRERIGEMEVELFREFFQALSQTAGITFHASSLYGTNAHHRIEGVFKAAAKAIRQALEIDSKTADKIPSTKGTL